MKLGEILKGEQGLTLLELVVVTGILTILSAIVATSVAGRSTEGRDATKVSDESTLRRAVGSSGKRGGILKEGIPLSMGVSLAW